MFFDETLPAKQPGETRIAHLSDLHVTIGRSALAERTRRVLKRSIADNLAFTAVVLDDARAQGVDHLVITGDLAHGGRIPEFRALREILGDFDDPRRLSVIPGNHDRSSRAVWRRLVSSNAGAAPASLEAFFEVFGHLIPSEHPRELNLAKTTALPYVKFIGPDPGLALIGINTTSGLTSRLPGLGSLGKVSHTHLLRLRAILRSRPVAQRVKIVLMHHHPMIVPFYEWFDNLLSLRNSKPLLDLLYSSHVDLILHGHRHEPFCWESHTYRAHDFTVVCAGPPDAYANGAIRPKELIYNIYALRNHEIHIHYQRCSIPERAARSFRFSKLPKE